MCYTCGCKKPYDPMGDSKKNIYEKFFEEAGSSKAVGKAGKLKAKQNMLELLKLEFEEKELEKTKKQY